VATLDDVYADYLRRAGDNPRRGRREIRALVQASGVASWDDVDEAFWQQVRSEWLRGEDDITPFVANDDGNARYRAIAMQMGLLD